MARSSAPPSENAGEGTLRKEGRVADYERIETEAALKHLAKDLVKEPVIAFDTEADSFYHYFDKTCLVQIATRKQIYLVDPLALGGPSELSPLAPIMASPDIRKIFHAAEYDIFVLKRDCSFVFDGLFDFVLWCEHRIALFERDQCGSRLGGGVGKSGKCAFSTASNSWKCRSSGFWWICSDMPSVFTPALAFSSL